MTSFGPRRATSLQPSSSFDSDHPPSVPSSSLAATQSQLELPQRPTFARTASASSFASNNPRRRDTSRLPIPEVVIEAGSSSRKLGRPRPFGRTQSLNTASGATMTGRSDSLNIREWMNTSSPLTSLPSTSGSRTSSSQVAAPRRSPSPPKRKRESATPPAKASSSRLKRAISEDIFDSSDEEDKAFLAAFSDSDDSLADITIQHASSRKAGKARASTSPAPLKPELKSRPSTSRKTLESDASEADASSEEEVKTDASPSKSTRGFGTKPKPYNFKPSLHQLSRRVAPQAIFAQKAGIIPPSGKSGKFSIDSLLKEKKRQGKRGTDAKGLGLLDEATARWEEQPVQPSGVDREAMKKLNDAYVARATEGLGEDGDVEGSADEEEEREDNQVLSDDSGDDYNPLHFLEDDPDDAGANVEGPDGMSISARSEQLMLSLAAEEGDEDQQKALVKILARDRAATRRRGAKGRSDGRRRDELAFWRRGRVDTPPETLPLPAPQGIIEKSFNEALESSPSHLCAFLRSRVLLRLQPASIDIVTSLLYLSILHGILYVASAALSSAEDLLRKWPAETLPELGIAISSLLMKALRLMGAEVEATGLDGTVSDPKISGDQRQAERPLLTAQHRGKLVYRFLRTTEAIFSAQSHDRELFSAADLTSILAYIHAMACDPASYGPATLSQFQQVMEAGLEKLEWSSFESWAHLLDVNINNEAKPFSHSALLRSLQAFPSSSTKSRILRRSRALSALFGIDEQPAPIIRGLKALASTLSSDDPIANPFYIHPPSSAIQTNYAELNAKVELLAIGFSDLALQLCEPGVVSPTSSSTTTDQTPGGTVAGAVADAVVSMDDVKTRPPLMAKQDSEQAVNDLLATGSGEHGSVPSPNTAAPAPTPVASKTSSSSGPTLKPNRAFRLALQPYKSDQALLRTFGLTSSSSSSSSSATGGSQAQSEGDVLSAPSFGRLREFHKILAALRGMYSRIHEGRGRLDGASATATAAATGLRNSTAAAVGADAEGEEDGSSTTLDKTRCKDAIQRLILSVHYQCEVFTGYRMGGDAILEDSNNDDEEGQLEMERVERKRALEDEGDAGAGAASIEGEPASAIATSAKKQKRGPRASDQRSLGEFFTPPAKGRTMMKRQETVRFGRDEQEEGQEEEGLEKEKIGVEEKETGVEEQADG